MAEFEPKKVPFEPKKAAEWTKTTDDAQAGDLQALQAIIDGPYKMLIVQYPQKPGEQPQVTGIPHDPTQE